jgi:hypothetical protein
MRWRSWSVSEEFPVTDDLIFLQPGGQSHSTCNCAAGRWRDMKKWDEFGKWGQMALEGAADEVSGLLEASGA